MTIRVSPTEPDPTHHISLRDRDGNTIGLIMANEKGEPDPRWNKTPIDRTALKTTSGGGSYSDFNPPYAPIVQDDWSGGRGNLDFERDSTRYADAKRINARLPNKVTLGPQEYLTRGYRNVVTGSEEYNDWHDFNNFTQENGLDHICQITPTTSFTAHKITLFLRPKRGTYTQNLLTINLRSGGVTGTIVSSFSAYVNPGVRGRFSVPWGYGGAGTCTLVAGTTYWLTCATAMPDWQYLCKYSPGGASSMNGMGYVILEPAEVKESTIFYEYKGQQYMVISPDDGSAPKVWMNGDRGMADSNAGDTGALIDATKNWPAFPAEYLTGVVVITQGLGKGRVLPIASSSATRLAFSYGTVCPMDTTTEYIIVGSKTWRELTGHGLTTKVTAVLAVGETCLFAQGDAVLMRRHREYNNAGVWSESDWAAEAAGSYATHLCYQPLASKVWRAQNVDATGLVSISAAPMTLVQAYGTALTFAAVIPIGYKYELINGLTNYPNDNGADAIWAHKEELSYIVITAGEGIKLQEMKALKSKTNGQATLVHNVYQYFTLGNGMQRYYSGSIDSVGPNLDEGLPSGRAGAIIQLIGYPGRVIALVPGGVDEVSNYTYGSIQERVGGGWHEIYRTDLYAWGDGIAQDLNITAMAFQVMPKMYNASTSYTAARLWFKQGNLVYYLAIGDDGANNGYYPHTYEGHIILSRMHAGMYDVQKIIKSIKIWADDLEAGKSEIYVDYRVDGGAWVEIPGAVTTSPKTTIDLTSLYGIAGNRLELRLWLFSQRSSKTPILRAVIVEAVLRSQAKYRYAVTARLMDDEPTLVVGEMDEDSVTAASQSANTKLAQLEAFADADNDSLLLMRSTNPLYDNRYVFINPPATHAISEDPDPTQQWTGNGYIATIDIQDA